LSDKFCCFGIFVFIFFVFVSVVFYFLVLVSFSFHHFFVFVFYLSFSFSLTKITANHSINNIRQKRTSLTKCTRPRLLLNGPFRVEDLVRLVAHQSKVCPESRILSGVLEFCRHDAGDRTIASDSDAAVSHVNDVISSDTSQLWSEIVLGGLSSTKSITVTAVSSSSALESDVCSTSIGDGGKTWLRKYFRMSVDGDRGESDDCKPIFWRGATGLFSGDAVLVLVFDGLFTANDDIVVLPGESQQSNVFSLGRLCNARRSESQRSSLPFPNSSLPSALSTCVLCDTVVLSSDGPVSSRTAWTLSGVAGLLQDVTSASLVTTCNQHQQTNVHADVTYQYRKTL